MGKRDHGTCDDSTGDGFNGRDGVTANEERTVADQVATTNTGRIGSEAMDQASGHSDGGGGATDDNGSRCHGNASIYTINDLVRMNFGVIQWQWGHKLHVDAHHEWLPPYQ